MKVQPTPHLLATKLLAPLRRPDMVERQRLIQRLDTGVRQNHQLILVSAPAGYGKTTLVVDWLHQQPAPFHWLSLDEDDNDLLRFFSYVVAALQQIDSSLDDSTARLLASPPLPSAQAVAATLINYIASAATPFFLVLDDYNVITAPAIHEAVAFLLDHQPPQLRLVLTTREDPPLPLARLRVRGLLTEIRANDLRFSHSEAAAFFQHTMHLELDAHAVDVFGDRTEGWIAGLQLAGLSVQGLDKTQTAEAVAEFGGRHHFVLGYLLDEVLKRQPCETQEFLRQIAILDRFGASLCDAVTGREDSRAVLTGLKNANLFLVPLDLQRQWYRFHHLFADALRAETEGDPELRQNVHQRAAQWFEAHGFERDATKHALTARSWAQLVSLRAVKAIEKPEALHFVQEALALTGDDDPIFRQYDFLTLGLAQQLEGATSTASDNCREAVRVGRTLRVPAFTIHAVHDLAITLIKQLQRLEAEALCNSERNRWADARGNPLPMADLLLLPLAVSAYEANDLVLARELASRAREAKRCLHQEFVVGVECEQILIRACAGLGDWEAAWRIIHEVRQADTAQSWFVSHTERIEADLLLSQGNLAAAERWATLAQVSLREQPGECREPYYLSYTRLLLAQGRPNDALAVLPRLHGPMQAGGRLARLITVHILQALAEEALKHTDSARRILATAVQLAALEGYSRRFLAEGPTVAQLLPAVRSAAPEFVDALLAAFGSRVPRLPGSTLAPSTAPGDSLIEPLTEQEIVVLSLLAEGLSYQDIAERLVVTHSTTKWHVLNIYGKLGVHNRTHALTRAQELGLLQESPARQYPPHNPPSGWGLSPCTVIPSRHQAMTRNA